MADHFPSALQEKRIVITRALVQSEGLYRALRAAGAAPLLYPLIRIGPVEDHAQLDDALAQLRAGDWIFLTSQNAVPAIARRASAVRRDFFSASADIRLAAVGPASEKAAQAVGLKVRYVAKSNDGVSLANELGEQLRGRRVLLPRSDVVNDTLPEAIRKLDGVALEAIAYRTQRVPETQTQLSESITGRVVDAIVCFSPSAVDALLATPAMKDVASVQNEIAFVAIGPVTANAFRRAGIANPLVAAYATPESAVDILREHFANHPQRQFAGAKKT